MMHTNVPLFCPEHLQPLKADLESLFCTSGCSFTILNNVPRFTNDEYTEAFGYQWKRFPKTQLDSYSGTNVSKARVEEVCGNQIWGHLQDKTVLEVGCGAGRFTEILLESGATVCSADLSQAVDANIENFPLSPKHLVIQADVARLPLLPSTFDIVFCLGVIQHTPNPEATIKQLAQYLKPGGWLLIDHYGKSMAWNLRTAPIVRAILKRLSPEKAFHLASKFYSRAKSFYLISNNRIYRKLLNVVFPVVYFGNEIPDLPLELRDEWGLLDTYDSLTDWYKHRRRPSEIHKTLVALNLENIKSFKGGNGVVARAQRPN
jgi:2-polyprenyl-3-methyl-5-hydroxy-6-metoxy-1,4-benzoquinol methylase